MPRILRILNRFNLGGPTYNAAYLTKFMPDEYQTVLIGGQKDPSEASSLHITRGLGIEPFILKSMKREVSLKNDRIAYEEIRQFIRDFKPHIVHTHASKAGALGRLAAIKENVPNIVHTFHGHVFHGYFNPAKTQVYKSVERHLASKSNSIIAISEIQKEEISTIHKICDPEKISVIPLGFDLNRFETNRMQKRMKFREKHLLNSDEVAIGIIGRLVPIKNHQLFLKGIQYLKQNSQIHFKAFVVGDGEERTFLENKCRELDLKFGKKNQPDVDVIFTSWIKDVDHVLPGLDVVALTSLNEGTPVSLIEAQAAQVAIVSTNVGGIENVVLPNRSALLSNVEEEAHFADNLLTLVQNTDLRLNLSAAGRDFVFQNFHYTRLIDNMTGLYERLLKN